MSVTRRICSLAACLMGLAAASFLSTVQAESKMTIGANSNLADGSRALMARDYDTGIRLTLAGLKREVVASERTKALSNLCAGYVGAQQYQEAIDACTQAIELRDSNWRAFNNRAIAYLGQGNLVAAREDLVTGLALNPDSRQLRKVEAMIQARDPVLLANAD